jgi:hypothetical protein
MRLIHFARFGSGSSALAATSRWAAPARRAKVNAWAGARLTLTPPEGLRLAAGFRIGRRSSARAGARVGGHRLTSLSGVQAGRRSATGVKNRAGGSIRLLASEERRQRFAGVGFGRCKSGDSSAAAESVHAGRPVRLASETGAFSVRPRRRRRPLD